MKIISKIEDQISEELDDSEKYIKCALEYKDTEKELARMYYELSMQEMDHADTLHSKVVAIISDYRERNGDPPSEMLAVYNYLHDKEIQRAKEIKVLQQMYR